MPGGRREGAGRKPGRDWDGSGEYKRPHYTSVGLWQENYEWVRNEAEVLGVSQATVINTAIELMMGQPEVEDKSGVLAQKLVLIATAGETDSHLWWVSYVEMLVREFEKLYDPEVDADPQATIEALEFIRSGATALHRTIKSLAEEG